MTKHIDHNGLKAEIIVHVLNYLEDGSKEDKENAMTKLKDFAAFFHVLVRTKAIQGEIISSLKEFILNKNGYVNSIPKLYNLLYFESK